MYQETFPIDVAALGQYAENATRYTVGPYDRLILSVWQYPDLSGETLVKEDGTIFVPNAGNVALGGLSLRQAQEKLRRSLEPFLPNVQVDVKPAEIRSKVYYVAGEVKNPGAYPVFRPVTLGEAAALAGGFTQYALIDNVYLSRGGKAYPVDLGGSYSNPGAPIYLQAGDMLYIPSQASATVYVLGEVAKPSAVPISGGGLGVLQAISAAGGIAPGADEDEVAVIRRIGGKIELRVVNVEEGLKFGSGDALLYRLRPGDIVWVPPMGIANWNRTLSLIAPTLDTLLFKPLSGARDYFLIKDILDRGGK